jgi:CRP-like cAMP-binding protein
MKKFPVEMKNSPFFEGIEETEEEKVLKGLDAHEMTYDKENYILHCGEQVKEMGLLVSGGLLIVQEDFWGNRNLVAKIEPGDVFAGMQRRNINVSVIAEEAANVLWLNVRNILDADGETEGWKLVLLRNLLENMAEKNLRFNEKLTHMGKRNTREKLLSYLSAEAQKHGTSEFDIPFSRQQLADYLSVERSAMSTELGKLRDEGRLSFRKNHFCLNRDAYL